jgi:hypothetical protein
VLTVTLIQGLPSSGLGRFLNPDQTNEEYLKWWSRHRNLVPKIARMTRNILASHGEPHNVLTLTVLTLTPRPSILTMS